MQSATFAQYPKLGQVLQKPLPADVRMRADPSDKKQCEEDIRPVARHHVGSSRVVQAYWFHVKHACKLQVNCGIADHACYDTRGELGQSLTIIGISWAAASPIVLSRPFVTLWARDACMSVDFPWRMKLSFHSIISLMAELPPDAYIQPSPK